MAHINGNKLSEIADSSATAYDFFDYAAKRARNVRDGISRIVQVREQMRSEGYNAVPQDLLAMFKQLQDAGAGTLNEKGQFKWNVPIKEVGKMVKKGGEAPAKSRSEPLSMSQSFIKLAPSTNRSLVFCLGADKEVKIDFTSNLTKQDIELIATKLLQECSR